MNIVKLFVIGLSRRVGQRMGFLGEDSTVMRNVTVIIIITQLTLITWTKLDDLIHPPQFVLGLLWTRNYRQLIIIVELVD